MLVMNVLSSSFGKMSSICSFVISDSCSLEREWGMKYFMIFLVVLFRKRFRVFLSAFFRSSY